MRELGAQPIPLRSARGLSNPDGSALEKIQAETFAASCVLLGIKEIYPMDKEHLKGAYDKTKGAVKETIGKATGDKKREAEGKMDKAKGQAHTVAGDVKDAARDATKKG